MKRKGSRYANLIKHLDTMDIEEALAYLKAFQKMDNSFQEKMIHAARSEGEEGPITEFARKVWQRLKAHSREDEEQLRLKEDKRADELVTSGEAQKIWDEYLA